MLDKVTCPICYNEVKVISDRSLRKCMCGGLTVDCDTSSIRYIGVMPMEELRYLEWSQKNKETILKLQEMYKTKSSERS